MMNRRDHTFAVSLIESLLLHAAIVLVAADDAVRRRDAIPPTRSTARSSEEVAYVVRPPPPPPQHFENLFGDARGTGEAINARRGDQPLLSRDGGQTQAFLSRDPVGMGKIDKEPSMSAAPTGSAAMPPALNAPPPPPPAPRVPFGVADRAERWSVPHVTRPDRKVAPPA